MNEPSNSRRTFAGGNGSATSGDAERRLSIENNGHLTMTQSNNTNNDAGDCDVVWDESKNIDLRRLASPHFQSTPGSSLKNTPSGAASTATSSSSLSSNNVNGTNSTKHHLNHHHHHHGHSRRRRSSLSEVSRSLQPVVETNNRATLPLLQNATKTSNNNTLAPEQEMDGIFQRLAEDENSKDALLLMDTTTPKQTNTTTNNTSTHDLQQPAAASLLRLEAENLFGVQPRRRRRKRQKMLLEQQQLQQHPQDQTNDTNQHHHAAAPSRPNQYGGRRHHPHHHRHLRCLAPVHSNTIHNKAAAAGDDGGPTGKAGTTTATNGLLTDDFEDLLQHVTMSRAATGTDHHHHNNNMSASSHGGAGVASFTTTVPPGAAVRSPVPPFHHPPETHVLRTNNHSNNNHHHASRKVSTTPNTQTMMNHDNDDDDDDFADFDLTMDDLNALDMAATQYQQQQPTHQQQQQQQQQQQPKRHGQEPFSRDKHSRTTTVATGDCQKPRHANVLYGGEGQMEVVVEKNRTKNDVDEEVDDGGDDDDFEDDDDDDDDDDDPFSEFPMIDYDALDNAILQATQKPGTNSNDNTNDNPPPPRLPKVHRSPMPGASSSKTAAAPKCSSSLPQHASASTAAASAAAVAAPNSFSHQVCSTKNGKGNEGKVAAVNTNDANGGGFDDDFDDFPDVDFDALDQVIANHNTTVATQPPDRLTMTAEEAIARDLDYLANVNRQQAQQPPPEPMHHFQTIPIPLANAVVRNQRVSQLPVMGELLFPKFSRFKVVQVVDDNISFTKTLYVAAWQSEMLNDCSDSNKLIHRYALDSSAFGPPQRRSSTTTVAGAIHLRGEWYYTRVVEGDVIHICSLSGIFDTSVAALPIILHTFPPRGSDTQDDLVLIVHPDMLLTPTVISETASCTRRAIIKSRLGSSGVTSKALIFGTMRHELFEQAMRERNFSTSFARDYLDQIIRRNAEGLLASNTSSKEATIEVMKMVPTLQQFATELTSFGPQRQLQTGSFASLQGHGASPPIRFRAKAVDSIEESIVSHELGLKGNVDMVVEATVVHNQAQGACRTIMGVELKTGHNQRTQNAHLAQLVLYTIMIQGDRGGSKPGIQAGPLGATNSGVLLYLNAEGLSAVHVAPHLSEMKTLIGQRNHVATEYARSSLPRGVQLTYEHDGDFPNGSRPKIELLDPAPPVVLPELLSNDHMCKKCYTNRECMMYASSERSSTVRDGDYDPFKSHNELLGHFAGHLTAADFSYFQEWDRLIDLEAHAGASLAAESWLKSSVEQEQASAKCISSLVFDQAESLEGVVFDEENSFGTMPIGTMSFTRSKSSSIQTPLFNLGFEKGCHVIVSTDSTSTEPSPRRAKMHIVRGFMARASESQVFVRATKDDLARIQKIVQHNLRQGQSETLFRLDRDNVATGVGTLRQNLVNLFTGDRLDGEAKDDVQPSTTRLSWLRDMLIRLRPPVFQQHVSQSEMFRPTQNIPPIPGCDLMDLACEFAELNIDQRNAAIKVWSANDYTLIQGLPGTGKTSTIAFVVRLLAAHGKRVLITSYTHAAVDNVVRKLMRKGLAQTDGERLLPALVRVGRASSSHPSVVPVLASEIAASLERGQHLDLQDDADSPVSSPLPESLRRVMDSARIVGVTALTIPRSALLLGQEFDVVIVDEAGQISQPAIIGALMTTKSFILVGDHKQLPPLVTSEAAEEGGYGISMLMRLADRHPLAVAQLTLQYRMHEDICTLCNDLVYGGTLKCGNDRVRSQKLDLPSFMHQHYQSWLQRAVHPDNSVIFLDTDKVEPENQAANAMCPLERLAGRSSGGSIVNDSEAAIVRLVVEGLVAGGLDPSSIGVICPFRAQLRKMDDCPSLSARKKGGLEMSTIDQFQGRDKPTIILSFVRSNVKGRVGRLLSDVRRLNVALSRAKCKLIMVGSYSTLYSGSSVLRPVLDRVNKTGRVVQLPSNYDS